MVNELYELSVSRIINIEMVSLFSLLFLSGLDWINFNLLVPNTSYDLKNDNGYYISPVLSYFIISFVIFAIALIQYSTFSPIFSPQTCYQDMVAVADRRLR